MIGLFNRTLSIYRGQGAGDGYGGYTTSWELKLSGVPCRVQVLNESGRGDYGGKQDIVIDAVIYMPYEEVAVGDRVEVDNVLFEVREVKNWALANNYLRLAVSEVVE